MGIFPVFEDEIAEEVEEDAVETGFKELRFDFKSKRIVIEDGHLKYASARERIEQWVELLIKTEMDKYNIYKGTGFGYRYLYSIRGHSFSGSSFAKSEMERELRESLEAKECIDEVKNINISIEFNVLRVEFRIITGCEEVEGEVIQNV